MFGGYGGGGSSSTYTEDANIAVPQYATVGTFAHGLGQRPRKFGAKLICTTADGGFAVGDTIELPHLMIANDGSDNKLTIWANATNVKMAMRGNPLIGSNTTGGGEFIPTLTSWRVRLWAEV